MNQKMYSFTPSFVWYLLIAMAVGFVGLLVLCGINEAFGTQTVLQTFPGTKSVCTLSQYNYSLKHTECKTYATVPATCKKTEHKGPVWDTFVNTTCE